MGAQEWIVKYCHSYFWVSYGATAKNFKFPYSGARIERWGLCADRICGNAEVPCQGEAGQAGTFYFLISIA